jgi:methyltransferase family protein
MMSEDGLYREEADTLPPDVLPLVFATWAGATIPGVPPEAVQRNTVGAVGLAALAEGHDFFRVIREFCKRQRRHVAKDTVVLDYGCGWGRITRFFLTVYDNRLVYGVDVSATMVHYCETLIGAGQYSTISGRPPLPFPAASIDVLYAYSVFSHLSGDLQNALVTSSVASSGREASSFSPPDCAASSTNARRCEACRD